MQNIRRASCIWIVFAASACGDTSGTPDEVSGGGNGGSSVQQPQEDATTSPSNDAAQSSTGGTANVQPVAEASVDSSVAMPDSSSTTDTGDGGKVTASCAGGVHPLCLDFESGKVDAPWTAPNANAKVEEGTVAHGRYAIHLSNLHSHPQLFLHVAQMPGIKDVLWGRFYLYMDAGAPNGHGALVRAFDMQNNWYEVGFESNSYLGNWHVPAGVPERYMRSKFNIPKKAWACVEFAFDGATPDMAKVWSDGAPVTFDDIAKTPNLTKSVQFTNFDIGIIFFHGTSLATYEGDTAPSLTDMWLDDIALDSKRVGCL